MSKQKFFAPEWFQWRVPKDLVGTIRADVFLKRHLPGFSHRILEDLFSRQCIQLNGRPVAKGFRASPGDLLEMKIPGPLSPFSVSDEGLKLTVVFEDPYLLVIEKPGLVPTHPLSPFETRTLANALVAFRPEIVKVGTKPLEPGLVHRLDIGTSGLLVAALEQGVWLQLKKDLAAKRWEKTYQALVEGVLQRPRTISFTLAHDSEDKRKMKVIQDLGEKYRGRVYRATTQVRPIKKYTRHTLVDVRLITGVTHQIRAHLAFQGHPVLGDTLYGSKTGESLGLPPGRFFLHARQLSLPHPVSREPFTWFSELPTDLQEVLSRME
ncbi:MAG: RluA family pseudouridine synthase [Deltaproteobacteria bacterium]|nr:RluA family pseudouridine synthase [Deltaproteobacteria bacterium]